MSMYGSIHTHFESRYDTGNDLADMCKEFQKAGCKKVAVTEHGAFSSFEDLRDISAKMEDFEIIPGIEGYFERNSAHMVLVAKNYEGYLSLCRIITESNQHMKGEKAIITLDNLRQNVSKGNLICTTACIAGLFGHSLGLSRANAEEDVIEIETELQKNDFNTIAALEEEYQKNLELSKQKTVQKRKNAEKAFKQYGNRKALENVEALELAIEEAKITLAERAEEYKENHKLFQSLNKKKQKLEELKDALKKAPSVEKEMRENKRLYNEFVKIFGKKDFYFELQNHGLPAEKTIYNGLITFAKEVGHTNFIASNDIHIGCTKEDMDKYERLILRREVIKFTRFNKYQPINPDEYEYYIKTNEELRDELLKIIDDESIVDGAITNIERALSECSIEFPKDVKHYPKFCDDEEAEFDRLIEEGIKLRFPNGIDEEHKKRIEYESGIIKKMGFVGYHLIVADYLKYARLVGYLPDNEIANAPLSIEELDRLLTERKIERVGYNIGPGRGSGAGSCVCYVLGITDLDPLRYGLLFERFLNTERVSMPDIDSDFRTDVREKAVEYVKARYGEWNVCQIITKSYGAIKGNSRLAARYFGSKECYEKGLNPEKNGKPIMKKWYDIGDLVAKSVEADVDGNEFINSAALTGDAELLVANYAEALDGVFTGYGQHAAGTIISGCNLTDIIPLMYNDKKKNFETQCTMAQAEAKGVLKMDFLGLENLNMITEVERLSKDARLQDITLRDEILADKAVYENIFQKGLTQGVFQFESDGMKSMLRDFKPECFEDLILLVSVYRPGPMDYIPEIIASKWYEKFNGDYAKYSAFIKKTYPFSKEEYQEKKEKKLAYFYDENGNVLNYVPHSITLKNEALDKILKPTYGCPVYQEQIMQIFQTMAGYSLGGADIVRRYMSKKKTEALAAEKEAFIHGDEKRGIPGCVKLHGITEEEAETLFEQMMPFAKYGFNKSHAAAYALVSFFTAWQKNYYPAIFYAVSLNHIAKLGEIYPFVKEMQMFHVKLKAPSLLLSRALFTCEGNEIRYGLKFIKGLSEKEFTPLPNPVDFLYANARIGLPTIEGYIRSGLFDEHCPNRQQLVKWFEENGKKIEEIGKAYDEIEELRENGSENTKMIRNREEKIEKLTSELRSISYYHDIPQDIVEDRRFELENLGTVFSYNDSMELLKKQADNTTFDVLEKEDAQVNAVVLSCVGPKKTKKSDNTYYEVTLRDCAGNEIVRRFDQPVTVLEGRFFLTSNEGKFFLNRVRNIKPLRIRTYYLKNADDSTVKALQSANGNVNVKVYKNDFLAFRSTEKQIKELPENSGFYLDFSR